jgi:hypothetical protein
MATFEQRMYELGVAELAEQERHVAELRSRPATLLAAGALVPALLARAIVSGAGLHGWELVSIGFGIAGGIAVLLAAALILVPYEMGFSLDASYTYRWLFRQSVVEQPGVDLVLADALHERRRENQRIVDRLTRYLTLAIIALAVEVAGFAAAAALAS